MTHREIIGDIDIAKGQSFQIQAGKVRVDIYYSTSELGDNVQVSRVSKNNTYRIMQVIDDRD